MISIFYLLFHQTYSTKKLYDMVFGNSFFM